MKLQNYLWSIPFLSFLAGYFALQRISNVDHLAAPTIVGRQLQNAVAELSDKNLNLRLITQKEDPDLPEGTILSQTPAPGQKIKPHQSMYVVISKTARSIAAPNLLNKPHLIIKKELESLGVRQKNHILSSNRPSNRCIAQTPAPGKLIQNGKITTYLSSGNKKPVLVPNLKGKSVSDVAEFLHQFNVKLEILHASGKLNGHTCDSDCIISDQRPLAGSIVTLDDQKPLLVHLQVQL